MQPKSPHHKLVFWSLAVLAVVTIVAAVVQIQRIQAGKTESDTPTQTAANDTPAPGTTTIKVEGGVTDAPSLVLELYSPSDQQEQAQISETKIRENIEQVLSTGFALSQCQLMDSDAMADSFRASLAYAVNTHFAKDMDDAMLKIQAIYKAAAASYVMLYRNTDCKNPKLATIAQQMVAWQDHYLGRTKNGLAKR